MKGAAVVAVTLVLVAVLALLAGAGPLRAQTTAPAPASDEPLFTRRDALVAGAVSLGTAGLMFVDRRIADAIQQDRWQNNTFLKNRAAQFKLINERSLFATSVAAYAVGRVGGNERMAEVGLRGAEAILAVTVAQTLIKGPLGRSRPFVTRHQDPFDFNFMRGFKAPQYRSLPSLHEGGTYAAIVVLADAAERSWPHQADWMEPTLYAAALLPGLARMYANKHWASDVLLGSALGIAAGKKVIRYSRAHPDNRVDRWLLGVRLTPAAEGGVAASAWVAPRR